MKRPSFIHTPSLAIVLSGLCLGFGAAASGEMVDTILATVDTEVILQSDVIQEIAPEIADLRRTAADKDDFNRKIQEKMTAALDQAIENKILLREGLLAGIEVTDDNVEARIKELKKQYPTNEAFQKDLEEAGETMSDFREHVRKRILAVSMGMQKRREFEAQGTISEADVAQYYEDHKSEFVSSERVRIRRIFISAGQDAAERATVRTRMEEIQAKLAAGEDFAELAKAVSEGPEAESGGMVGWVARGDFVEVLEQAAFALGEGETSGIVETEFGFNLLQAEAKEASGAATLSEARTGIEPKLRAKYADEQFNAWMAELRKRSRVRVFL
jgi:parvulin-like peptidyl-prolyl isomerase